MKEPVKLSDFKPIGFLNLAAILLMVVTGYRETILAQEHAWRYAFVALCLFVGLLNVWVLIRGIQLQRNIRVLDGQIRGP
jgi:hypothetical protein